MSRNLNRERGMYVWESDRAGKSTNIPIDSNNHCFDAIRYGVYTRYLRA
jgi:phage terminase large subunit